MLDLDDRLDAHLPGVAVRRPRPCATCSRTPPACTPSRPAPWWERSPGGALRRARRPRYDGSARRSRPGATFHYTNLAFGLLGEVVARHRGAPWWDAGRDADPRAARDDPHDVPARRRRTPPGYSVHHYAGTLTARAAHDAGAMAPAGQVWSTVTDLARYARFLLDGHPTVLSRRDARRDVHPAVGAAGHGAGLRARPRASH